MKNIVIAFLGIAIFSTSARALEFVYQEGNSNTHSDMQVTYIMTDSLYPDSLDTNYASSNLLHTFNYTDVSRDQYRYTLIRFSDIFGDDWEQIPDESTISTATLTIRSYHWSATGLSTIVPDNYVHMITEEWVTTQPSSLWENTVTWNNFSHSYSSAFASFDPYTTDDDTIITIDISQAVTSWLDSSDPQHIENYGLMISATVQAAMGAAYYSDDYATLSYRPELNIEFTAPAWEDIETAGSAGNLDQDWTEDEIDSLYELYAKSDSNSIIIDGEIWYYLTDYNYAQSGYNPGNSWEDESGKFIYLSDTKGGITTFDGTIIPEPISMTLLACGLLGGLLKKRLYKQE